jgi:membrane protein
LSEASLGEPWHVRSAFMKSLGTLLHWFARQWSRRRMPGLAAEAAFWLFFALIPLAAVTGLIAARIATQNLDQWMPLLAGAPASMQQLVTTQLNRVAAWNSGSVAPLAALMFLWLASSGIHALFDALEADLGRDRSWLSTRIAALLGCLLLAVIVAGLVGGGVLLSRFHPKIFVSGQWKVIHPLIVFFWSFVFNRGLFQIGLSRRDRCGLQLSVGAALAAILQTGTSAIYVYYISKLGDGSAYLAGLASVGVTLTALFLYTLFLLVGLSFSRLFKRASRCKRLALIGERRKVASLSS